ncbi:MAG TPA: NYN domain-containing protein [Alphaproteobacteria bacterium]|nr:NYN domain-containing protein [Alphaproteobacteria bacterium]
MNFYPQERIGIFIDGSNLYSAARALNFDIDYKRLLEYFSSEGRLIRAFYYTALFDDQEYSPIRPLVDWLDYNGYTMVTKPTKEFTDAQGRRKIKGNMDIELAVDVMEMADNLDHIVIFSGDGDFRRLVEVVQRKGARVTVVSTVRSQPPMVADELRRQADYFIELKDIQSRISRRGGGPADLPVADPVADPVCDPVADPGYPDDFDEADAELAADAPAATPANPDPHPEPAR